MAGDWERDSRHRLCPKDHSFVFDVDALAMEECGADLDARVGEGTSRECESGEHDGDEWASSMISVERKYAPRGTTEGQSTG